MAISSPILSSLSVLNLISSMLSHYEQSSAEKEIHRWVLEQLKEMVGATAASLFWAEQDTDKLICIQVSGGKDITGLVLEPNQGIAGAVFQTKKACITPATTQDSRHHHLIDIDSGFKTYNMITAPIFTSKRSFGVVQLLNKKTGNILEDFSAEDLALVAVAAQMMAQGIIAIEMASEIADRLAQEKLIAHEFAQAYEVQKLMLKPVKALQPICAKTLPAKELGGDFYDYFITEDRCFFCIGDVAGKGVPAALVMSCCISLFRSYAWDAGDIKRFAHQLNTFLLSLNSERFVVITVGVFCLKTRQTHFLNCGHSDVMQFDFAAQNIRWFDAISPPLGIVPLEQTIQPYSFKLAKTEVLVMLTDGIAEKYDMAGLAAHDAIEKLFCSLDYTQDASSLLMALLDDAAQKQIDQHDDETACVVV